MATSNMHNLTTLIKRLEAATSRLEDIASSTQDSQQPPGIPAVAASAAAAIPPSQQAAQAVAPAPTPKQAPPPLPESVEAFDALINEEVKKFAALSDNLGGLLAEQSALVLKAFGAQRRFLIVTTKAKKPDVTSKSFLETIKELQNTIEAVNEIRVANRASEFFPHLSTVSEGIPMLGWVTIDRKPADYVTEMLNSAQFYGNKVLKEYKEKDPKHVEWVRSFYAIHKALISYIQDNYATGVTWNNKDGIDAAEAVRQVQAEESSGGSSGAAAAAPPPAPGPPPPPPLPTFDTPPPPPPMPAGGAAQAPSGGLGAVFSQISQGEAVTKGLRKVDTSEMTHKNPSLRADSRVPPTRSDSSSPRGKSPVPGKKPQTLRTKKPPKKELDGKKWVLENFDAPADGMIEIEAEISQSILISRCNKTTIRVIGKANAVSIDSSSAVSLIIDSLVSSVEVIKVPKFEMQVLGNLPTIMLDQVDGAQIYLGRESLGTEVFTSKCTAVNINVPGKTDEDDYREEAVPEQLKTVIRDGRAVSEIVEHAG